MQQHEQAKDKHAQDAHDIKPVKDQTPATEIHAGGKVPPVASAGELTGAAKEEAKAEPLGNVDAVIEQLAHGMVAKELDAKDEAFLHTNGYEAMPIVRGQHEFVMRTFVPTQGGKPPVVAFRGTVPTKIQTIIADLDPSGIGMYQFNPNRALIAGQMQMAASHGSVVSAGHSLGGALAQIAAAAFPDLVQRIVTFQAPGVSRETAKKIADHNAEHPEAAIESTHHRVAGDLVPMGGEALTPGVIHEHKMTGGNALQRNPLAKHVSMPLAEEEIAKGHDVPIHGNGKLGSVETGEVSTEKANAEKNQTIEHIRTGLGKVVYGVGRL